MEYSHRFHTFEKLKWKQDETGLHIRKPKEPLPAPGCSFRIFFV